MDRGLGDVGAVLGADRDVAELARAGDRLEFVDREGEDVGRRVLAAVLAVQLADPLRVDDLDREVPFVDPGGRQRGGDGAAQLGGNVGQVDGHERGVGPCSARAPCSRLPCAS